MKKSALCLTLLALVAGSAATALAQGMPTTQPKFMHVFREQLKPGRSGEHAKWEAGWPAAYEKAKSPYHYIALQSITGPPEVWYVVPLANQAAYGEMMAAEQKDPALAAELERLKKGDAEFRAEQTALQAVASAGPQPRGLPGHREDAVLRDHHLPDPAGAPGRLDGRHRRPTRPPSARSAPNAGWRTYDVVAGAPGGTFLIFSSVGAFADFDRMMAEGEAAMKGATPDEMGVLGKFMKESVLNVSTNRYRLDPGQSYVNAETKAMDPAFWAKK